MKKKLLVMVFAAFSICINELNAYASEEISKAVLVKTAVITENVAIDGMKQALVQGTEKGVAVLSVTNGYFGNADMKIVFPPEASVMEPKLRSLGLGNKVDEFILSLNRAAEDAAATGAKPIFNTGINGMVVKGAINIINGGNDAATNYFKQATKDQLAAPYQIKIQASLDKVGATKLWASLATAYNKLPGVQKQNPDLTKYVTLKAIDGLFIMIAKEELKIRKDPAARTSDLLKKVFLK